MDAFPVDWSELPRELLTEIASRLHLLSDYVRFPAVCKNWAAARGPALPPSERPWVLTFDKPHHAQDGELLFIPLADRRPLRFRLPELAYRWICGASRGWFVTVDRFRGMLLLHPFTHAGIPLPCPPSIGMERVYPSNCIRSLPLFKAVLSADPLTDSGNCIIMAINGATGKLTFCRLGDPRWTVITDNHGIYLGLVHYNGRFYAAATDPAVVVCDLAGPIPRTIACASSHGRKAFPNYLVEMDGALLYVSRFRTSTPTDRGDHACRTVRIEVYKLNNETGTWAETRDLGKMALFLTPGQAIPILEEEFPGCKKNFIYFLDFHYSYLSLRNNNEMGMYDLANGTFHTSTEKEIFNPLFEPSLFITPVLYPGGEARALANVAGPSQTQDASA